MLNPLYFISDVVVHSSLCIYMYRNQTKLGSGHGRGTSGEGLGNSASKPCMASNHPSSADGAACLLDLRKQVSETSQKSKQDRSSLETDTAVDATPFRSPEAQKHGITGRQPARKGNTEHYRLCKVFLCKNPVLAADFVQEEGEVLEGWKPEVQCYISWF